MHKQMAEVKAEASALALLGDHPHIVRLADKFEDGRAFHLVMELCPEGDLFEYMLARGRLAEFEACSLVR